MSATCSGPWTRQGATQIIGDDLARVEFAGPADADHEAAHVLGDAALMSTAEQVRSGLDLGQIELRPHTIRTQHAASANADDGEIRPAQIAGYVVEYQQLVDGVPIINPETGYLRVHLDGAGNPQAADVAVRPVVGARSQPLLDPPVPGSHSRADDPVDAALRTATQAQPWSTEETTSIEGSREVGYQVDGSTGHIGAHEGYLVDLGNGLHKKVRVSASLNA